MSANNIACLAWGSLIWKPDRLPVASRWQSNGPALPLEFARESDGGELAVVLCPDAPLMRTWWTRLAAPDLASARELLREREQAAPEHPEWIGSLPATHEMTPVETVIASWMGAHGLHACVWTALPPRSAGQEGRKPSAAEAVAYLNRLKGDTRAHAEDYVRRVPAAVATPYRKVIEEQLGWTKIPTS